MSQNSRQNMQNETRSEGIKSKVTRALTWYASVRFLGQLFTWCITIVVVRLLTPEDYGQIAIASILIGLAIMVGEVGIGGALIQSPELDKTIIRQMFGILIAVNVVLYFLVLLISPIFASFFNADNLASIIRILDTQILVSVFSVIPIALLKRRMDFKELSLAELAAAMGGSLTALGMAWYGFGVWSLVAANLATSTVLTFCAMLFVGFPQRPSFGFTKIREQLAFAARSVAANFMSYLYTQSDKVIIGRIIGETQLGYYTVANTIALIPMTRFTTILSSVSFPAYSTLRQEKHKVRTYFLRSLEINFFIFTPILWGLSVLSKDAVDLVLGVQWTSAAIVLQIISLIVPLRMQSPLIQAMLLGIGRADVTLRNVFTNLLIVPPALLIGTNWGLVGVCFGWVIGFLLAFLINLKRTLPVLETDFKQLWILARKTLLCATIMYVAVIAAKTYLLFSFGQITQVFLAIFVGAVLYVCLSLLLNRSCVERTWRLARGWM